MGKPGLFISELTAPNKEAVEPKSEIIYLKTLLYQWQAAGKSLDALSPKEVLELEAIADRYHGRGSAQAQSILNFWYGYTYLPKYEDDGGKSAAKLLPAPTPAQACSDALLGTSSSNWIFQ